MTGKFMLYVLKITEAIPVRAINNKPAERMMLIAMVDYV
jgi:hypothetical protein